MATVSVVVNGRPYAVGCEDGQEDHVRALAAAFDQQVREVAEQVGQVGDLRLFLMAALLTADELAEARARLNATQAELARSGGGRGGPSAGEDRAAKALDQAAARLEALAERLA